tara:strand:+ start:4768 stop:5055 length:288 start_codon:yes stop_codon:yes gene_type:complete
MNKKRKIWIIVLILFVGSMIGTIFGDLIAFILPDGVVKQFFLQSTNFSLSSFFSNDDYIFLNLGSIGIVFGLKIKLNFSSIIGFSISYYFLRYFR